MRLKLWKVQSNFMNIKDKIKNLSEDDLRKKVIIPLLSALGCSSIRDNCNPTERGKDILYITRDHFLREKIWGAAVVKKDDINKAGLDTVNRQIIEAITKFIDPDDPRNKIQIHELLVITAGKITDEAQKFINDNSGKCFQNIHFVSGDKLDFLINEIIIQYNKDNNKSYTFDISSFEDVFK